MLNQEYKNFQQQMQQWESFLGLPKTEPPRSEIEKILILKIDEIKQKTKLEISEYSFILSQYALFLQRKNNECESFLRWSQNISKRIHGDDISKLHQWIKKIELRLSRLSFLSKKIENMAKSLQSLSISKHGERK